ncbi:MAG: TonB-dependent receptor plug domain-containing protein [Burkholderiales bacterium]|jgi:iron complex outermembrane receptor protein
MPQATPARIACALICAASGIGSLAAQELSEREFLTEFPAVLSASRLRQDATETPQAVTVIDQETIKASGAREFAELFRLVPGFTVSYVTYVKGLQPIVTYHGLGREFFSRLQVLIDGRSINNATLGGVDWSDFPLALDDVDRIEVIRGPSNASHGIGAFLATINFITKHAAQERGASVTVRVGDDRIRDAAARVAASAGPIDYRVTAGHRGDDGFVDVNDARKRDYVNARADWQLGASDNLMLQAGATDGVNGISGSGPGNPQRSVRVNTSYAQVKWERSRDADNGFYVQFYYYQFHLLDHFLTEPLSESDPQRFAFDGGAVTRRSDLEFQQNVGTGPDLRWVWGASAREDETAVPLLFSAVPRLDVQRLFGHVEWHASDKILVNAGAMVEHNNLTGTDVAPQLALNYQATPTQTIRFSVSRALRTPTVIESQSEFGAGPPGTPRFGPSGALRPETILSREISYVGEWPTWNATLDVKLFYDTVHDLIDLVGQRTDAPAAAYPRNAVNGDDVRQTGVEGQLTWRPFADTRLLVAVTHIENSSADRFDTNSTSAPRDTVHALLSHRFADTWDASVGMHWQSAYQATVLSDPQRAFSRVDVRIARQLPSAMGKGEIGLTVENLFDDHYTEFRRDDVARRRAWLTLGFRL